MNKADAAGDGRIGRAEDLAATRVRGGDDPSAPGIVSRMCDALLGVAL